MAKDFPRPGLTATRRTLLAGMAAAPAMMGLPIALKAAAASPPPFKVLSIVARKPGLSQDRFRQHWLGIYGPMARKIPQLLGFLLSEAVQDSAAAAPQANYKARFDGVAHIWYRSQEAMRAGMGSRNARDWLADGNLFIDREASRNFIVSEQIVVPPPRLEGGLKRTLLLVRKPGTTHKQFLDHWTKRHADLAQDVPGLLGCVFNRIETSLGAEGDPWAEIDGITETWWDGGAANMGGRVESPRAAAWAADGDAFLDGRKTRAIVSIEHVMIALPGPRGSTKSTGGPGW